MEWLLCVTVCNSVRVPTRMGRPRELLCCYCVRFLTYGIPLPIRAIRNGGLEMGIQEAPTPVIDDGQAVTIYCSRLERVDRMPDGINCQLTLVRDQIGLDGLIEAIVVARIIRPIRSLAVATVGPIITASRDMVAAH
jgi:hypothetical protein